MQRPRAYNMVELIVAMTLFLIVVTSGIMLMDRAGKASKKVEMKEYLYRETQLLLKRVTRAVEESAVDYEEYYSRNAHPSTSTNFGENYGDYHEAFFAPSGYETGTHPYSGNPAGDDPEDANAFCPVGGPTSCSTDLTLHQTDELFLINREGDHRTYFILDDGAIKMLELDGTDTDQNGIAEDWTCSSAYTNCSTPAFTPPITAAGFLSITPEHVVIDDIQFYISPLEDPFKAFNETTGALFDTVQVQPSVTIVLTAHYQPYDSAGTPVGAQIGDNPTVTIQATATTGVYEVVPGFEP